jgi:MoaA/NifB/PqqE/SkfB family radical SAM enzyme
MDNMCLFRPGAGRTRLLWEVTRACNLRCRHCYVQKEDRGGLPLPEMKAIADRLPALGVHDVVLSGGEPLLRNDLYEIVAYLHRLGLGVDLCTNGTLLDADRARELSRYLDEVSVSLDGCDAASYEAMRRHPGGFDRVVSAIEQLGRHGCEVHLITVVARTNHDRVREIVRLGQRLGAESITLMGLLTDDEALALSAAERAGVGRAVRELQSELRGRFRINTKRIFNDPPFLECRAGLDVLGIDARGYLLPCILFKGKGPWSVGASAAYALPPAHLAAARREIEAFTAGTCRWCASCGKGCLGSFWVEHAGLGCDTSCPWPRDDAPGPQLGG